MTYDPDCRYAHDLEASEAAKPLAEDTARERGQFWNVDRHIRGRWIYAGLTMGFVFVFVLQVVLDLHPRLFGLGWGASMVLQATVIVGAGGLLGFVAATIRRRYTNED